MHGFRQKLPLSALVAIALTLAGCTGDESDQSGGSSTSAVDPQSAVGPPKKCAARLIDVVDADYMRERGVAAEPGQEALFRLARERVIADLCSAIPAATPIEEAAEEAARILQSEAD